MTTNVTLVVVFCRGFVRRPEGDVDRNAFNHLLCKGT